MKRPAWDCPQRSARNGGDHQHHYYHRPACAPAARAVHRGVTGSIDVLSAGYVVLPPSRHRSGESYEWVVPPTDGMLPDAPGWAIDMLATANTTRSSQITPTVLPVNLPTIDAASLEIDNDTRALILHGRAHDPDRFGTRSEALFAAECRLVRAGYDDVTIAALLLNRGHAISAKPLEQGHAWLLADIARARETVASGRPARHASRCVIDITVV